MEVKKIAFITTGQPSTNPRIKKEICLAQKMDFKVEFVYCPIYWEEQWDEEWLSTHPLSMHKIHLKKDEDFVKYAYLKFINFFSRCTQGFIKTNVALNVRSHWWLAHSLIQKALKIKADLYVTHYIPALYAGYLASKHHKGLLAFDMEDYHPGERIDERWVSPQREKERREFILRRLLPHCAYVSFAAEGYYDLTRKHLTESISNPLIVHNVFPSGEFIPPVVRYEKPLQCIWFSQTIGRGRGLELLLDALSQINFPCEITLIGNLTDTAFGEMLRAQPHIKLKSPVPQAQLHRLLSEYDVGLALELKETDLNRNYALTNKLFAYLQAGLYVLATDTEGQKAWMQANPGFGRLCGQSAEGIYHALTYIHAHLEEIRNQAILRYERAKALAWEQESRQLAAVWKKILSGEEQKIA